MAPGIFKFFGSLYLLFFGLDFSFCGLILLFGKLLQLAFQLARF
jgi:hypothetical protein